MRELAHTSQGCKYLPYIVFIRVEFLFGKQGATSVFIKVEDYLVLLEICRLHDNLETILKHPYCRTIDSFCLFCNLAAFEFLDINKRLVCSFLCICLNLKIFHSLDNCLQSFRIWIYKAFLLWSVVNDCDVFVSHEILGKFSNHLLDDF